MFCYQCEQAAGGSGCTKVGVCGKSEDIQSLQDIMLFGLKGMAAYAYHARELGAHDEQLDAFTLAFSFATGKDPVPLVPGTAALQRQQVNPRDLPPTSFSPDCDDEEASDSLGQDFLTWLWSSFSVL